MSLIPAPRPAADNLIGDAELHAEVARRFAAAAETAREQSRFLLTVQAANSERTAKFEAAVADLIGQHVVVEEKAAQAAKETAR